MIKKPNNYLDLSRITKRDPENNPFINMKPDKEFRLIIETAVPNLEHFFAEDIGEINEDFLPRLKLKSLGLGKNKLSLEAIKKMKELYPNLEALYLDGTGVRLCDLKGLSNLKVIEIDSFLDTDVNYAISIMPNIELINNKIIIIDD